ncbi:MAG: type II toxin-antitoxin system Phd/YefM family antitoxin, partial [Pseudomonadota bacterium]
KFVKADTMNIRVVTSTEAQNQFGKLVEDAKKEPIMIQKNGRDQVVMLSAEEYEAYAESKDTTSLVMQLHDESIEEFSELYTELAK